MSGPHLKLLTRGMSLEELAQLRAAWLAEQARRSGSKNFASFVKQAWPFCPQVDPLVWNWHMEALCLHFEEVARGGIRKLLVNVPPGHAKSVLLSVLWPAWIWTWWPKCQFLFASYSADLAIRDSVRCRAVIESDWYQETHARPSQWGMRHDQNAKGYFVNTAGGERFATGVGGTGRRAHVIGIDDPLDANERLSKAARDSANDWIGQTLSQRFVDASTGRIAMIMQRLHEEDPSGFVLDGGGWEHLMLPSEFESHKRSITYHTVEKTNGHVERVREEFWRDPRQKEGELLFPQKFPADVLEEYKKGNQLGREGFAGQHQQNPAPTGGGMFRVENWRYWTSDERTLMRLGYSSASIRPRGAFDGPAKAIDLDDLDDSLISVDATFRETIDGSYVAIHVWGRKGSRRLLLDRIKRRMDFTDSVKALLVVIQRWPEVRRKLIEAKANGDAILSTLKITHGISGLEPVNPGMQSKIQRAHAMQPYQSAGDVELPNGAPWLEDYISEHAAFPNGAHNDDVDAQAQALQGLEKAKSTMELWEEVGVM